MADGSNLLVAVSLAAVTAGLLAWLIGQASPVLVMRYREAFTRQARSSAEEHFLAIDPGRAFRLYVAALATVTVAVVLGTESLWLAGLTAALLIATPTSILRALRRVRSRRFDAQLPDALLNLAGALRAGAGLVNALQQIGAETPAPLGQEITLVLREQRLGLPLDQALANLEQRVGTPAATLVVAAIRVGNETGGGMAEILERTAATVRSAQQMEAKIRALTAQGTLQAWVMSALPMVLLFALYKVKPDLVSVFWTTRIGIGALVVIGALEALGVIVIRRVVRIDV